MLVGGTYICDQMCLEYARHGIKSPHQEADKEKGLSSSSHSKDCFPSVFLMHSPLRQKGIQVWNGFNFVHE